MPLLGGSNRNEVFFTRIPSPLPLHITNAFFSFRKPEPKTESQNRNRKPNPKAGAEKLFLRSSPISPYFFLFRFPCRYQIQQFGNRFRNILFPCYNIGHPVEYRHSFFLCYLILHCRRHTGCPFYHVKPCHCERR